MAEWLRSQMQHLFVIAIVKEMGSSFKPHQRKILFCFLFFVLILNIVSLKF